MNAGTMQETARSLVARFPEPRNLNVQVVVDELQFFSQRHKGFMLTEQPSKDIAKPQHHAPRCVRIKSNQR